MFYSQYVLAKKGKLGQIWLAAHMEKKVPKSNIIKTNIPESVESIENPQLPLALRVSGHLLLGVVRIFSRKVNLLYTDCSDAMLKIKDAFRTGAGPVSLAPGADKSRYADITNPEDYDDMDLDMDLPSQVEMGFGAGVDFGANGVDFADVGTPIWASGNDHLQLPDPPVETMRDDMQEDQEDNFGYNKNWQDFFEGGQDARELPPVEDARADRAEKRRRLSKPDDAAGMAEADELPEREQLRSAADGSHLDAGDDAATWTATYKPAEAEPSVEFAEMDDGQPTGFEAVMQDELPEVGSARRGSAGGDELGGGEAAGAAPKSSARKPKRKGGAELQFDEEIQLAGAAIKARLADTSSITRDLSAPPAPAARGGSGADPFTAAPSLEFIPAHLIEAVCPPPLAAKKARVERGGRRADPPPVEQPRSADEGAAEASVAAEGLEGTSGMGAGDFEPTFDSFGVDDPLPVGGAGLDAELEPEEEEPVPSFAASRELPNVDGNAVVEGTPSKGDEDDDGRDHSTSWSARTQKMYATLADNFEESKGMGLSYNAMVATTSSKSKRRVVAGCFQELLFLTTHGLTELTQAKPYGDIVVTKTELFDTVAIAKTAA